MKCLEGSIRSYDFWNFMEKKYKLKKDFSLILFAVLPFIALFILQLNNFNWISASILIVGVFISVLFNTNTNYSINFGKLSIKTSILKPKNIDIQLIKSITKGRKWVRIPFLKTEFLEIKFGRYNRVIISPENNEEFIEDLLKINPKIEIE